MSDKYVKRFWSKVQRAGPDECWHWQAGCFSTGYGAFWNGKKLVGAHCFSSSLIQENPLGLKVCHTCDNPICVNPNHLFLGTTQENAEDMVRKGRHRPRRGVNHPNAKLTEEQEAKLDLMIRSGKYTQKQLAKKFGIDQSAVSRRKNHKLKV